MRITVIILTCDRTEFTKRTVKSFLKHNDRDNFDIFYGDDASTDTTVHSYMKRQKIPCLMKNKHRNGCSPSSDMLVRLSHALNQESPILYLQNDFESIRPIPLGVVQEIFDTNEKVGWIRLFGLHKNNTITGGNPTDPTNKFRAGKPIVKWKQLEIDNEKIEIGDAQWSYNPAIHRGDVLRKLTSGATRERDVGIAAANSGLLTARFVNNITNHIGIRKTTPGGKFGKPNQQY